jgi:hypothetical protein
MPARGTKGFTPGGGHSSERSVMSAVVNLQELLFHFEAPEGWRAFWDRETGRVSSFDSETLEEAEEFLEEEAEGEADEAAGETVSRVPDWQGEIIVQAREVLRDSTGKRFLEIPGSFEFHEYRHMQRFVGTVEADDAAEALERALRGRGAFRRFKERADDFGVLEDWYAYRDSALREFFRHWAEREGLTLVDEPLKL